MAYAGTWCFLLGETAEVRFISNLLEGAASVACTLHCETESGDMSPQTTPDGIFIERSILKPGFEQVRITWMESRGLGPLFGTSRGRGSLALVIFGVAVIAYFLFELTFDFLTSGNSSAFFLGIMIGVGFFGLLYLFLSEWLNQRVLLVDSNTLAAVWRPLPGFNSWKKATSSVKRLYNNDYCLYVEFSDGSTRFLLPRDMTGERRAFVKTVLEKELGLTEEGALAESDTDELVQEEKTSRVELAWLCPVCSTEGDKTKPCAICGAEASATVPSEVTIKKFDSHNGQLGLEIIYQPSWKLLGFGILPTVFWTLMIPGSFLLAGGWNAFPYFLLLLIPSALLFYIHLLGNNQRIIRFDRERLSVRYKPFPRPGWSRQISEIEELAEFPRRRFQPKLMPTTESDIVHLVVITKGFGWSPQVLFTYDRDVFQFVRSTLKTFLGKKVVRYD